MEILRCAYIVAPRGGCTRRGEEREYGTAGMRLFAKWILAGIAAGALSGALFGWPYAAAGAGLGAAAGLGIALGLRIRP